MLILFRWAPVLLAALGVVVFVGCEKAGVKTFPVEGKVELSGSDPNILSGHVIEAVSEANPEVRAYGSIEPDGSFRMETLHAGKIIDGAQEGKYQVRVVLGDDDPELRRQAAQRINPRHLDFATSGVSLQVPASNVVLRLDAKQ